MNKKMFVICLEGLDQEKKSKIMDSIEYLDCKSIFICDFDDPIADNFCNINELVIHVIIKGDIVDAYKEEYEFLSKLSSREISARRNK